MGFFGKVFKSKTDKLISDLNNKNMAVRKRAILELARIGEPAVEPLIEVLMTNKEFRLSGGPPDALATIGQPAIRPLVRALRSNPVKRFGPIIALAKMTDGASQSLMKVLRAEAVEPLLEVFTEDYCKGNMLMLNAICSAFTRMGDPRTIEPLKRSLEVLQENKYMHDIAKKTLEEIQKLAS